MNYTEWLRRQVARLEADIRSNPVFDTDKPASPEQLRQLRETIVLRTYMRQQLLRRERFNAVTAGVEAQMEAEEQYVLVPVPVAAFPFRDSHRPL